MLFDIPYVADWTKIGDIDKHKLTAIQPARTCKGRIMTTRLGGRYSFAKMVSFAKQSPNTLGRTQSPQFIQMEQLGFRREL